MLGAFPYKVPVPLPCIKWEFSILLFEVYNFTLNSMVFSVGLNMPRKFSMS